MSDESWSSVIAVSRRTKGRKPERERKTEGEVTGLPMTPNLYLKLPQQCRPDTDTFTSWPHVLSAATSSPKKKTKTKKSESTFTVFSSCRDQIAGESVLRGELLCLQMNFGGFWDRV